MKVNQSEHNFTFNVKAFSDLNYLSKGNTKNSQYINNDIVEINKELKYALPAVGCKEVEFIYSIKTNQIIINALSKSGDRVPIKTENLPKELKEITNPIQLSKFLKNSYAKVTTLDNGEYKLYLNGKLLGGDKEYLYRMLSSMQELLINRTKPSGKVLQILNIDPNRYSEVADNILVPVIGLAAAVAIEELKQDRISVNNIDSVHFKSAIDAGIFCKQKQLIDSNTYGLLFPISNGLEGLSNKIFNKKDTFTIHAVKCFFSSIRPRTPTSQEIENWLTDKDFIKFIGINAIGRPTQLGQAKLIKDFKDYAVQLAPNKDERAQYKMHDNGICHGSCLVNASLEEESFNNRGYILEKSSQLQNLYHAAMEPDDNKLKTEFAQQLIETIENKGTEAPSCEMITEWVKTTQEKAIIEGVKKEEAIMLGMKQAVTIVNKHCNMDIDYFALCLSAREKLKTDALENTPQLKVFNKGTKIYDDNTIDSQSFNNILRYIEQQIKSAEGNKKHMVLITLVEKGAMQRMKQNPISAAHDVMVRIDTNNNGYITRATFCDLQDTGLYTVQPILESKNIQEATPQFMTLIDSYSQGIALNLFEKISAKYICK